MLAITEGDAESAFKPCTEKQRTPSSKVLRTLTQQGRQTKEKSH